MYPCICVPSYFYELSSVNKSLLCPGQTSGAWDQGFSFWFCIRDHGNWEVGSGPTGSTGSVTSCHVIISWKWYKHAFSKYVDIDLGHILRHITDNLRLDVYEDPSLPFFCLWLWRNLKEWQSLSVHVLLNWQSSSWPQAHFKISWEHLLSIRVFLEHSESDKSLKYFALY